MREAVRLDAATGEMRWGDGTYTFDLRVVPGEFLAVMGPSRSGKSLLLELCAGLIRPQTGRVLVLGSDWEQLSDADQSALRLRIGVVLQQPGLLSNMTVFNNVALPLRYHRGASSEAERAATVLAGLDALALTEVQNRFPAQLSIGEARCAAIARALMLEPEILLLDDAVSGLDAGMMERLQACLEQYRSRRTVTILISLRSPAPLLDRADRVVLLRGGRVEAVGSRDVVLRQAEPTMKSYLT